MKITLGFTKYVEEDFELPEEFEFVLTKDKDEYTADELELLYDFEDWKREVTGSTIYDKVDDFIFS